MTTKVANRNVHSRFSLYTQMSCLAKSIGPLFVPKPNKYFIVSQISTTFEQCSYSLRRRTVWISFKWIRFNLWCALRHFEYRVFCQYNLNFMWTWMTRSVWMVWIVHFDIVWNMDAIKRRDSYSPWDSLIFCDMHFSVFKRLRQRLFLLSFNLKR